MPRLTQRLPSYRKHKASRQAVMSIDGKDACLGPLGSKASKTEYESFRLGKRQSQLLQTLVK